MARKNYPNYGWRNIFANDGELSAKLMGLLFVVIAIIAMGADMLGFFN